MPRFRPEDLEQLCENILIAAGADPAEAREVSIGLVIANRRGIDSHGMVRLPVYMARFAAGLMAKKTKIEVVRDTLATAVVDANNGWGAVASKYAMNLAIEKAEKAGVGIVGVNNSNHYGIAAHYGMMALKHDMIGFSMTNASPSLAPWGGRKAYFGTNPICVCIPALEERPIVYDGATSVVARGKVALAYKRGQPIPPTWAADSMGRPTTNAAEGFKGLLLPLGGYKGTGLGLMVDVLSGVLNGGGSATGVGDLYEQSRVLNVGHYFQAVNISAFGSVDQFKRRIDSMIREIHQTPLAADTDRIYVAGEIEFEKEIETQAKGIELAGEVLQEVTALAAQYGVPMPQEIGR